MKKMFQERQPEIKLEGEKPNRTVTLTLWKPTPSCNEWTYRHWRKYHSVKREWRDRIGLVLNGKIELSKANIKVNRFGRRLLDYENAVAGLKPVTDALVYFGLLADDNPKCLPEAPTVVQTKVSNGKDERTVLIIEELQ